LIFLTGDMHGEMSIDKLSFKNNLWLKELTSLDYLIILGDFGLFWNRIRTKSEEYWLNWLSKQKYTILFLDGNHENFELINSFKEIDMFGGKVGAAYSNIYHLKRGEVYTIDGYKILTIGGALSMDRAFRILNFSYWEEELLSLKDIKNIENNIIKYNHEVDYILTHTPPEVVKSQFGFFENYGCSTAAYFNSIYKLVKFKHWYCGHMHIDETHNNVTILYDNIIELK